LCARERQMTVLVYVIAAIAGGGVVPLGHSAPSSSVSSSSNSVTDVPEAVDDRLRDVAGVVRQVRRTAAAAESAIRRTVTLVVLVDDFTDVRVEIRHATSCP
jgi:hypothetical protein